MPPGPAGAKGPLAMSRIANHAVMKWSPDAETAKAMLLPLMDKDQYQKWTMIASGYNAGPFAALHNDPVFATNPKLKAFQDVVAPGKWPGWPSMPTKKTARAQPPSTLTHLFSTPSPNRPHTH